MNTSEVKKYSEGLVKSIKSGKLTFEEAVIESSIKTGCTKDYARKILNDYLKSGYSNNPDYVGDWFGKGQIDFNAIINPEDDGDVWMVKMWSGSGYTLDVYLCKATSLYDAIDTVFEWSWENEGENNMVFDLDYVYKEADEYFESDPYMFSVMNRDEPDKEDFEDRFIEEYYVGDSNYGLFARSENFFVDKVPEDVLAENQEPVQNSHRAIKSSTGITNYNVGDIVIHNGEKVWKIERFFNEAGRKMVGLSAVGDYGLIERPYHEITVEQMEREQSGDGLKSSRKPIKSMARGYLKPEYDSRASFYNKAETDDNKLYSYGTLVAEIKDGQPVLYPDWNYSQTTIRHVREWLKQNGFEAGTKADIERMYPVQNSRKFVKSNKRR